MVNQQVKVISQTLPWLHGKIFMVWQYDTLLDRVYCRDQLGDGYIFDRKEVEVIRQ